MKKSHLLIICLAVLLASCSKKKSDQSTEVNADSTAASSTTEVSQGNTNSSSANITLKGIYATSTQIPHAKFSYQNLFDGDKSTYWSTMPGAGPDEGIMLYFDKPL